jgi:TPR repeat protein
MPLEIPRILETDDEEENLNIGLDFYEESDWGNAIPPLSASAEAGNLTAVFKLANCLANLGRENEARQLLTAASENGHPGAMNNLANIFSRNGDRELALNLYLKAAQTGDPAAMFNYAVKLDPKVKWNDHHYWLRRAADAGHMRALAKLGASLYDLGRKEEGLANIEDAMSNKSLAGYMMRIRIAIDESEDVMALQLAERAISLPLNDDDKHMLGSLYALLVEVAFGLGRRGAALKWRAAAEQVGLCPALPTLKDIEKLPETGDGLGYQTCSKCGTTNVLVANYCSDCGQSFLEAES